MKDKTKINNIPDAVKLLDGATRGEITSNEYPENISILKACKSARKISFVSKADVLNALK